MKNFKPKIIQVEIAALLSVTQGYVSKVINGNEAVTVENARILAETFEVELSWLLAVDLITTESNVLSAVPSTSHRNFPDLINTVKHFGIIE